MNVGPVDVQLLSLVNRSFELCSNNRNYIKQKKNVTIEKQKIILLPFCTYTSEYEEFE